MPKREAHIYLNSAGITLTVKGPYKILEKIKEEPFLKEYIPNLKITDKLEDSFELQIGKEEKFSFKINSINSARISGLLNKHFSVKDLITVIEYCFELIRQREGIYCIHASASSQNNKAVVLMGGASGIGKTKVNYLLIEKHKFQFLSDEKTLLDKDLQVLGGIDKFIINKKLLLKNKGIEIAREKRQENKIPIGHIFQPVTTQNGELFVDEWNLGKANFHVYEELSRKIRGVSRRINKFTVPLDSIDNKEIAEERSKLSKRISERIPCATVYGSPEKVAKYISDKFASL